MKTAIKVVIVVESGCVQRVLAADPAGLDVIVLDYDGQDENANRTPVPGDPDGRCADVWPATVEPMCEALELGICPSDWRRVGPATIEPLPGALAGVFDPGRAPGNNRQSPIQAAP